MHLYRNAMDHGIEPASQRIAEGKSPAGHISLELCVRGRFFQLKLRDDGRGLAVDLLKQKAVEKGLIGADQNLTPEQIAQLVFASGFSTSEKVTEVSGRGVGMDAVKAFVEREGGTIELCFLNAGQGEGFRPFETVISLPKSFAVQSNPKSEFNRFMSNIVPSQHPMPVDV
jgi:two-component system chemotaxis sensor kinase CheA